MSDPSYSLVPVEYKISLNDKCNEHAIIHVQSDVKSIMDISGNDSVNIELEMFNEIIHCNVDTVAASLTSFFTSNTYAQTNGADYMLTLNSVNKDVSCINCKLILIPNSS